MSVPDAHQLAISGNNIEICTFVIVTKEPRDDYPVHANIEAKLLRTKNMKQQNYPVHIHLVLIRQFPRNSSACTGD